MNQADLFLYFIRERESIRIKKSLGLDKPWTKDPILQSYRFCNVVRIEDKVSQWLIKNWYKPERDHPNMVPAVAVARFFNLPRSLDVITSMVFRSGLPMWESIKALLRGMQKIASIFNGAYMVRGMEGDDKVSSVIDYCVKPLVNDPPAINTDYMKETHAALTPYYGLGSFMAGQVVADLRWALRGRWADKKTWAPIGPGSQRGLNRLLGKDVKAPVSQGDFNEYLPLLIAQYRPKLATDLTDRMEAMDWQNCLCEFDKYCRVKDGGRSKRRYLGT